MTAHASALGNLIHLRCIEGWMLPHFSTPYSSATEYIDSSNMDRNGTWGTDTEILTLAHTCMLNTCVYVYDPSCTSWKRYGPHNVDQTLSSLVDINPIKLLGYSHDIVVKSQIYAMKFASWHSKGIVKDFHRP